MSLWSVYDTISRSSPGDLIRDELGAFTMTKGERHIILSSDWN